MLEPSLACGLYVGTLLLAGMSGLFLCVWSRRSRNFQTAVVTTRSLAPDPSLKMIVDKPFVFALRDQKTGLVLFMGYVGTPPK